VRKYAFPDPPALGRKRAANRVLRDRNSFGFHTQLADMQINFSALYNGLMRRLYQL